MYSLNDVCKILNVSPATVQRWERLGYVDVKKRFDETRRRVYTEADLKTLREYKARNK